ncbi:MAG: hypothetical protein ABW178_09515 [Pseudoxanthomonas sp.]
MALTRDFIFQAMFNLSAPSSGTYFLAFLLGGLGVAARLHYIPALVPYAFWLVCAGLVVLLLGNMLKSL